MKTGSHIRTDYFSSCNWRQSKFKSTKTFFFHVLQHTHTHRLITRHTSTSTSTHTRTHAHICTHIHTHTTHTCTHTHAQTYIHIHIHMNTSKHMHKWTNWHTYTTPLPHTHTYIWNQSSQIKFSRKKYLGATLRDESPDPPLINGFWNQGAQFQDFLKLDSTWIGRVAIRLESKIVRPDKDAREVSIKQTSSKYTRDPLHVLLL